MGMRNNIGILLPIKRNSQIMVKMVQCMTWASFLWRRVLLLSTETNVVDLPYEIILNIFSRLPAELVLQCCYQCRALQVLTSSQSFINMHLERATSSIVTIKSYLSEQIHRLPDGTDECKVSLYFIEDMAKKIVPKSMEISINYIGCCDLRLFDSYKGLLLFWNLFTFVIWNPATKEQVIVNKPKLSSTRGFYFHKKSGQFKYLYMLRFSSSFQFTIYSLGSKSSKKTTMFSHPPWDKAPVILNGALYWMVDERLFERANGSCLKYTESILVFDMDNEDIHTIARPVVVYNTDTDNISVHLSRMGAYLCFCDSTSYPNLDLWVREDFAVGIWTKKHTINLEFLGPISHEYTPYYVLSDLKVENDDLLFIRIDALYRYNLIRHTWRKLKLQNNFDFVIHTSGLISLLTEGNDALLQIHLEE